MSDRILRKEDRNYVPRLKLGYLLCIFEKLLYSINRTERTKVVLKGEDNTKVFWEVDYDEYIKILLALPYIKYNFGERL